MATSIAIPEANPDDPDDHPERLLESAKCDSSLLVNWRLRRACICKVVPAG